MFQLAAVINLRFRTGGCGFSDHPYPQTGRMPPKDRDTQVSTRTTTENRSRLKKTIGVEGIEPPITESKSAALPLGYTRTWLGSNQHRTVNSRPLYH